MDEVVQKAIAAALKRVPNNLPGVSISPWVGEQYETGGMFRKRILVLGESQYDGNSDQIFDKSWTCWGVAEQVTSEKYRYPFWTNIAIAFLNNNPSLQERQEFWNSVSFYNYIQVSVGTGPRDRPTAEMWAASKPGFLSVLQALKPKLIVVLGYDLWKELPNEEGPGPVIDIDGMKAESCWYRLPDESRVLALRLIHPTSGGFSGRQLHPVVMKAIDLAQ